jgi:hypothetical protein
VQRKELNAKIAYAIRKLIYEKSNITDKRKSTKSQAPGSGSKKEIQNPNHHPKHQEPNSRHQVPKKEYKILNSKRNT